MKALRVLTFPRPTSMQAPSPAPALEQVPKSAPWGALSIPVHVADTDAIARAKSILSSYGHVDFTASQARDVLRWHNSNKRTRSDV